MVDRPLSMLCLLGVGVVIRVDEEVSDFGKSYRPNRGKEAIEIYLRILRSSRAISDIPMKVHRNANLQRGKPWSTKGSHVS